MKKRRILILVLIGLLGFALSGSALAKPAAGEGSDWWVFGGGGGRASAGNLTLEATLGQTAIGPSAYNPNYPTQLQAGFWYGMEPYSLVLPAIYNQ